MRLHNCEYCVHTLLALSRDNAAKILGKIMHIQRKSSMRRLCATLLPAIAFAHVAYGDVLHDHDNGPLTGYFGTPDSTEGSILLNPGASRWGTMVMTANHSIGDERTNESIILDGETTRLEMTYRRGVKPGLEVGIELPYVWHESGGLDPLVDKWHDWFGLSGGFRDTRPQDELEFLYSDEVGTQIDFRQNSRGMGDVRLFAGWQFRSDTSHTMALRLGVKLPTGDSDKLVGSGGTDVSLGVAGDVTDLFGVAGLDAYYRANAIFVGEPDLLADRYNDFVGHLAFGLGYYLGDKVELRLQTAIRGALYDSDIETLGDSSTTLTFGGNIHLSPKYMLSIGVSEDIKVKSAPDVAFQLALHYQPD